MERYSHDEAEWAPWALPLAVARPTDADQVRTIVRWCVLHAVPVVPRGAGTGLSGGANAVTGGVVVSFERMTAVLRIDPVERLAVVQPGVVNDDLRAACAEHGLWYPPDPASSPWSTIGGNVATNAGGVCCVKYGVTGDYVLALEVVTGTGELVRVGHETAKGVAGYDLVSLLVGSEGTLGLVTEVTVRLRPARPPEHTVVGFFDSLVGAGEAVAALARAGAGAFGSRAARPALPHRRQRLEEPRDRGRLRGHPPRTGRRPRCRGRSPRPRPSSRVSRPRVRPGPPALRTTSRPRRCSPPAASPTPPSSGSVRCSPRTSASPWAACPRCSPASRPSVSGTTCSSPTSRTRATATSTRSSSRHPVTRPRGCEPKPPSTRSSREALECGGTVTGEHGVGLLKRDGLTAEMSPAVIEMHRAIRRALDPHGVLNPGKVVV